MTAMNIEIDEGSGFCHGVVNAIKKAEEVMHQRRETTSNEDVILYCLGDIVHNENEVKRLESMGLRTINHEMFEKLRNVKVLLRAHGEPPSTYKKAQENGIELIDATCPVVLALQRKIKVQYDLYEKKEDRNARIVIFGKKGHAEVNGLVGQTEGTAIVVENVADAKKMSVQGCLSLFSQTTKNLEEYKEIRAILESKKKEGCEFVFHDTICRQVANRIPNIRTFASRHDLILFVSGKKSSNGKILFEEARSVNEHTYMISSTRDIDWSWMSDEVKSVGICGATSTPKWLMEEVREYLLKGSN